MVSENMKYSLSISHTTISKIIFVIVMTLIAEVTIMMSNNPVIHVAAIWVICIVAMKMTDFDIMHPYTWFSLILTLYSSGYAILVIMGLAGNYTSDQLYYPILALGVSLIFIGPRKQENVDDHFLSRENDDTISLNYLDSVIVLLLLACLIISFILLRSGYSGKTAMKQANIIYYRIGVYVARYLTFFSILRVCNCIRIKKKYWIKIILPGVAVLAFGFSTGERDAFIRFFIVFLFILFSAGVIKKRHFVILIPVTMIMLTLSVELKYYFLRGTLNGSFSLNNLLEGFLSSDFSAAGRNMQYLIDRPWTKSYFGISMLFTELLYPILPSSVKTNPDYWFNYVVHVGGYHGNAFTLVGTGYVIGGTLGVISLFIIVSFIVRWLYKRSTKNIYYYSAYLYGITIVMIAMRGSLSSIVGCLLKEVGICLFFCYVVNGALLAKARNQIVR